MAASMDRFTRLSVCRGMMPRDQVVCQLVLVATICQYRSHSVMFCMLRSNHSSPAISRRVFSPTGEKFSSFFSSVLLSDISYRFFSQAGRFELLFGHFTWRWRRTL